jgi:PAS domain-containing protein
MCNSEDYKIFFDDAPVALVRTNVDTGEFEMANNFAATLFGCKTVEELMEKHKSTDFYPDKIRHRLIKRLRHQGVIEEEELELQLPNDRKVWVKANFRLNCGGTCIECFLTDITEIVQLRNKHFTSMKAVSEKLDTRLAQAIAG